MVAIVILWVGVLDGRGKLDSYVDIEDETKKESAEVDSFALMMDNFFAEEKDLYPKKLAHKNNRTENATNDSENIQEATGDRRNGDPTNETSSQGGPISESLQSIEEGHDFSASNQTNSSSDDKRVS